MDGVVEWLDADVLVVGGGFGGAWAALRAAQTVGEGASVILVDKGYVSRSGASTMSGGVTTAPLASDDLRSWVEELSRLGGYESNQEWAWKLLSDQRDRIQDLADWGVPIVRDPDGGIRRVASRGMLNVRAMQYSPQRAMEVLRQKALEAGVRILDKVAVSELLTSDGIYPTRGRICGAIGIGVRTGSPVAIRARCVVLATGPITLKGYRPIDNDSGDGFAMAYRAGGELMDMEFSGGGTFEFIWRNLPFNNFNIALGNGARLINAHGERFMERYDPVRYERSELSRVVAAAYVELLDGRGPVFIDLRPCSDRFWEAVAKARSGRRAALLSDTIPNPRENPVPIEPTWSMWNGGRGGLLIDLDCRTNLPGLLAAGGVARNAAVGRHGSAGTPTAFAMVSGHHAGWVAAREAATCSQVSPDPAAVEQLGRQLTAAYRPSEPDTVDAFYREVVQIVGSPLDLMVLSADTITEALARTRALRERLPEVSAATAHNLIKLQDARNTLDSFELIYSSMFDRTESRESFYREDFPYTDDQEWLCWHTARRSEAGLEFCKRPIPFERYEFQPKEPVRKLSTLAGIFRREYDPQAYEVESLAS